MRLNALHPKDDPMEAFLFCFGGDDDNGDSGGDDMDAELDAISDQFDAMDQADERGDSFQTHGHSGYTSRDDDGNVTDHSGGLDSSREFVNNVTISEEEIQNIYIDELGRLPDPEGADYWKNDSGLTVDQIREAINNSPEGTEFDTNSSDPGNRDTIAINAGVPRDTIVGSGPGGNRAVLSVDGTPVTSERAIAEAAREEGVSEAEIRDRINKVTIDLQEEDEVFDDADDPTIPIEFTDQAIIDADDPTIPIEFTDQAIIDADDPTISVTTPTTTGTTGRTTYEVDPSINDLVPEDVDPTVIGQRVDDGELEYFDENVRDPDRVPISEQDYANLQRGRDIIEGAEIEDLGMPPETIDDRSSELTFSQALDYALDQGLDLDDALDRAELMTGGSPYSFEPDEPDEPASLLSGPGLGFDIEQLPGADQIQFNAFGEITSAPKEFQDAFEELTNRNPITGERVITIGGSLQRDDALSQEIESLLQEGYRLGFEDDELVSPEGVTVNIADLMGVLESLEGGSEGGGGRKGEAGGGGAKGGASFDPGGKEGTAATGQDRIDIDLPEVEADLDPASIIPDTDAVIDTDAVDVGEAETDATGEGRTEGESEEATGKGRPGGAIGGDKTGGVSILPGEEGPILPGGEGSGVLGEGGDDIVGMGDEGTGDGVGGGDGTGDGTGTGPGAGTGDGTGTGDETGDGTGDGTGDDTGDDDFDLEPVDPLEIDGYDFGDPITAGGDLGDFEYRQPQITSPFDFARDFGSYTLSPEIEQSFQDLTAERLAQGFEPAALYEPEFLEQIGIMSPERQAEEGIASLIGSRFPQFTPAGERYPFTSTPEESAQALVNELFGRSDGNQ